MKNLFFIVAGMLLSLGLRAQNDFYFTYGGGFSTTSSSLSFNYSVVCNNLSTTSNSGGGLYGRVFLQNGSNSYYVGTFIHRFIWNGWNGSGITTYNPAIYTEVPSDNPPSTLAAPTTTGNNTVTMSVNTTCIPLGTYTVRIELYNDLQFEIPHNGTVYVNVGGSTTYVPGPIMNFGNPYYDVVSANYIGDGNIGSFTKSSGGSGIGGSRTITAGTCTTHPVINTTTTGGTSPYTLYYSKNGGSIVSINSSSANINISNASPGAYSITVVDANGCRWTTSATTVKPTTATVNVTPASQTLCKFHCVQFSATPGSGGSGFSYIWNHSNSGTAPYTISTAANFSHTVPHISPSANTVNTYQVTMSNAYCSGTKSTIQTVNPYCFSQVGACSVSTPPGSNGRPSGQVNGLPMDGVLKLFPSPATGTMLNIDFNESELSNANIEVYDAMGRLMITRPVAEGMMVMELDISDFSQGMYVIRLVINGEVLDTEKFIR